MKNPFLKIFKSTSHKIPDKIKNMLLQQFPEAINIEWDIKDDLYEAVFYVNETEFIAKISDENGLTGYKKNLKISELPEEVIGESEKLGEIMNVIAIYTKSNQLYEVIIRDREFNRTLLLISKNGEIIESKTI